MFLQKPREDKPNTGGRETVSGWVGSLTRLEREAEARIIQRIAIRELNREML